MSDERRDGRHANGFAVAARSVNGGGTIPDEWRCKLIDLDELYMLVGDTALAVNTSGRVWVWWSGPPITIAAVAERKNVSDTQQSWAVTEALARQLGVPGFRIVGGFPDGHVDVTDREWQTERYGSVKEFVGENIRPLIQAREDG